MVFPAGWRHKRRQHSNPLGLDLGGAVTGVIVDDELRGASPSLSPEPIPTAGIAVVFNSDGTIHVSALHRGDSL